MSIGAYDPDGEENTQVRPAWSKPKDDLDTAALKACGRQYFKSSTERKVWRALRDKAQGATEEDIMYSAWMEHNVGLCRDANIKMKHIVRVFATLISMIENDQRRIDWVAANRERIMKERASSVTDSFFEN